MSKYILIGVPNCGKSTLGKRAAKALKLPFYDTDDMAVDILNLKNPIEIFRAATDGSFLTAQNKAMIELSKLDGPAIIATGAEVALIPECAELMRKMGKIIHIQRNPRALIAGLKNSGKSGPVMKEVSDGTEINMREEAIRLYTQENSKYEKLADMTLENNGAENDGANMLTALIKSGV